MVRISLLSPKQKKNEGDDDTNEGEVNKNEDDRFSPPCINFELRSTVAMDSGISTL